MTRIKITHPDGEIQWCRSVYSVALLYVDLAAFGNACPGADRWPSAAWCSDRGLDAWTDVSLYESADSLANHMTTEGFSNA
jgi:hypothetical protein